MSILKHAYTFIEVKSDTYHATLSTLGATLIDLKTKDKDNQFDTIIFGYKNINDYAKNPKQAGTNIGPYAGRIYPRTLPLSKNYLLPESQDDNCLHSGPLNFALTRYDYTIKNNEIIFTLTPKSSPFYPMPKTVKVIYKFLENGFDICYEVHSLDATFINMTNHTYFNLSGYKHSIKQHELLLPANFYVQLDQHSRPQSITPVKDTVFDFNQFKPLNQAIQSLKDTPQRGLDHPFLLKDQSITLKDPLTKRQLNITTSYEAAVIYTNNFANQRITKNNHLKDYPYDSICIECQHIPNDIHFQANPKSFLKEKSNREHYIKYRFSTM